MLWCLMHCQRCRIRQGIGCRRNLGDSRCSWEGEGDLVGVKGVDEAEG